MAVEARIEPVTAFGSFDENVRPVDAGIPRLRLRRTVAFGIVGGRRVGAQVEPLGAGG